MIQNRHVILGYPNSGKTTFLAALWYLLDAGKTTSISLDKISGDVRYLNEIKKTWLKCEQVPRTLISSEEMVEMRVRDTRTKDVSVLRLPDFSGETFQALFTDRECDEDFVTMLQESSGILFFINADRTNDMMLVTDHNFPDDDQVGEDDGHNAEAETLEGFDPRKTPEQTRIVEVLQLLQVPPLRGPRRRLVIAISAWDVVAVDEISPQDWIAREMPMLAQYIDNNANSYDVRYCGISAQGGPFEGETRAQLLQVDPAERVVCKWDGKTSSDITLPLTWLSDDDA